MRLYEYISKKDDVGDRNSDELLDKMLTMVEKDCQPFLKQANNLFFRGTKHKMKDDYINKMTARKDRKPLDSPMTIHKESDKIFKEKFGWKARSEGVFASTSYHVGSYGKVWMFFPIGNFKYVWSPTVTDWWIAVEDAIGHKPTQGMMDNFLPELINKYTDKDLKKASPYSTREFMFYCPNGYYLVNTVATAEFSYYLNLERA